MMGSAGSKKTNRVGRSGGLDGRLKCISIRNLLVYQVFRLSLVFDVSNWDQNRIRLKIAQLDSWSQYHIRREFIHPIGFKAWNVTFYLSKNSSLLVQVAGQLSTTLISIESKLWQISPRARSYRVSTDGWVIFVFVSGIFICSFLNLTIKTNFHVLMCRRHQSKIWSSIVRPGILNPFAFVYLFLGLMSTQDDNIRLCLFLLISDLKLKKVIEKKCRMLLSVFLLSTSLFNPSFLFN